MSNWAVGFVMGVLSVLSGLKIIDSMETKADVQEAKAEELIAIYERGQQDALKLPASMELEETCLKVWASKQ
jgi:hypothetical protein